MLQERFEHQSVLVPLIAVVEVFEHYQGLFVLDLLRIELDLKNLDFVLENFVIDLKHLKRLLNLHHLN